MQTIERSDLERRLESDEPVTVVEVLGKEEYDSYHLPTAIHVPMSDDFAERIQRAVPDRERPVVVYCKNEQCDLSPSAARKMDELGYQNVMDYAAGKEDWRSAGLPIEA